MGIAFAAHVWQAFQLIVRMVKGSRTMLQRLKTRSVERSFVPSGPSAIAEAPAAGGPSSPVVERSRAPTRASEENDAYTSAQREAYYGRVWDMLSRFDNRMNFGSMLEHPIWLDDIAQPPTALHLRNIDPHKFAAHMSEPYNADDTGEFGVRARVMVNIFDDVTTHRN